MASPSRAASRAHVAVFDATTLVAKGVKELMVARSFPTASVRLFTSRTDPEANLSEYGGEAMLVTAPDIDTLDGLDIAFLCGSAEDGALYLDWPARKGFVAIDLTSAASRAPGAPLVNAAVNPEAIAGAPSLIATPHPAAQILSSLLAPVRAGCGLEEAAAVVFQPASASGEEGIEELYQQTLGVLNFRDLPLGVFGRQLAFNLVPSGVYGGKEVPGGARPARLEQEVERITGGGFGLSVETILAPVFHGHAVLSRVRLRAGASREDLLEALRGSDEVRIAGDRDPATPVERAGEPGILITGPRPAGEARSFWIWAVTDNLISGTALNAVRIAEAILERRRGAVRG
jgi:aspartate-semialdehyde dehydrogenase